MASYKCEVDLFPALGWNEFSTAPHDRDEWNNHLINVVDKSSSSTRPKYLNCLTRPMRYPPNEIDRSGSEVARGYLIRMFAIICFGLLLYFMNGKQKHRFLFNA